MSDYKRRNINIDKLSSHVRKTGICTEEASLHLMDEIMFLRADLENLRDEMKLIAQTVGRSKTDGESDCDWHDLAGDVIHLKSTAKRLTEMVGAAYTAGWMAGYSTGGTLEDESETNLDWHCGEDWVEDGLRPELLQIIESV